MEKFQSFAIIGWIITGIMIYKLPNLFFGKTLLLECRPNEAMDVLQQNIRSLSFKIKVLLFISNIIKPTDKGWAGQVDFIGHQAQIMRLPRWYDVNPFSLNIYCKFSPHGHSKSIISLTPLLDRKIMIIDYLIISTLTILLQFIQIIFSQDSSLGIIDILQMAMIILFPLSFFIEWQVSLFYFKKLFDKAGIHAHY